MKPPPTAISILGVPVHQVTMATALDRIAAMTAEPGLHQVATVNPEFVMAARQNPTFLRVLQRADLCLPDGIGIVWAARLQGASLPERVAGSELVLHLAAAAAQHGWPLFLLGAAPGVAADAGRRLQNHFPALVIAGTHPGSPRPADDDEAVRRINASGAVLLYVAYGAPGQDLWLARNAQRLDSVRVGIGVGGALDFITGRAIRAPAWVQRLGLEWLHRLLREPWRWRRMLALPRFAGAVLFERLR